MSLPPSAGLEALVADVYRRESRRVFATLIRLVGDFDLAEDAMHDAFASALKQWAGEGVPANPRAWLVSTGRFKAIDTIRRRTRFDAAAGEIAQRLEQSRFNPEELDEARFNDDQLRLVFTCCHPALPPETRVALTLREVCGLRTEEVASAFLTTAPTIAQRIVRGKAKIRDAGIPYEAPSLAELPARLDSVLSVIYLVFNEGYSASHGDSAVRQDLTREAIRLGRLLRELLPDPEVTGLLALMLLHESRHTARTDDSGDLVLLEDQDRSRWDRALIKEGTALVEQTLATRRFGAYTIQAAISAVHASAPSADATDWSQIVALYDVLLGGLQPDSEPLPIVELNRAVAVAMRDGAQRGLEIVDAIVARGDLVNYHLTHAARADLLRRLGRSVEAAAAYRQALVLAKQAPERRFLQRRIDELDKA